MTENKIKETDFLTPVKPTWCAGCGNFGIWAALKKALAELGIPPHKAVTIFDIGCTGNSVNWYKTYGFHSLHGRTLPVAFGIHLANNKLKVIAIGGEGGVYGEGGNHFLHICRANPDIALIVSNNQLYSLTTGQATPTTPRGTKTKSTPQGVIETMLNPLQIAVSAGASFVSRGYADEISHLTDLFKKALTHKGLALVDVLSPCVTLNKVQTRDWYKKRIYRLSPSVIPTGDVPKGQRSPAGGEEGYDFADKNQALAKAGEWAEKIPIGVIYKEDKPTYEDNLPQIKEKILTEQKIMPENVLRFIKKFQ
jgi:2-oxoglutarate ferredoxin oxidoreductase subunit beta